MWARHSNVTYNELLQAKRVLAFCIFNVFMGFIKVAGRLLRTLRDASLDLFWGASCKDSAQTSSKIAQDTGTIM